MVSLTHNRRLAWLALVLWMGLIFFLSSRPDLPKAAEPWLELLSKKTAHFLAYATLAVLAHHALRLTWPQWTPRRHVLAALVIAVLYACSDEFHQSFVPNRNAALTDVMIDTLGASVGLLLVQTTRL